MNQLMASMQTVVAQTVSHVAFVDSSPLCSPSKRRSSKDPRSVCGRSLKCFVVLGGSSGVGLEAASYIKSRGSTVTSFSRRTGHDLSTPDVSNAVLQLASKGLAISVGAGRRKSSRDDELSLYSNIIRAICKAEQIDLIVAVARSNILSEVHRMFDEVPFPWVLLRPGPLVDEDPRKPEIIRNERLLVTTDLRCNGLVSRRGVGVVVGDLLLGRVESDSVVGEILGVYDRNRMINLPDNVHEIAGDIWGTGGG